MVKFQGRKVRKLCSCGFPQSYPVPHEHEQDVVIIEKEIGVRPRVGNYTFFKNNKIIYETNARGRTEAMEKYLTSRKIEMVTYEDD